MSSIRIAGAGRWDGTYELGVEDRVFNAREWRWIKQISDYLPTTIAEGFAGRDPSLFIALGVIAMCRSGKLERDQALRVAEEIAEAPYVGQQTIELLGDPDEAEDDQLPPASESESDEPSRNASLSSSDTPKENGSSSGPTSTSGSDQSDGTPSPTTA